MIKSPCTNICKMSINGKICDGCGRTIEEIINWGYLRDDEKKKIIQKIHERSLLKRSLENDY